MVTRADNYTDTFEPLSYQLDEVSKPKTRKNLIGCRIDYFVTAP